jgi:hypothetical protein
MLRDADIANYSLIIVYRFEAAIYAGGGQFTFLLSFFADSEDLILSEYFKYV